MQIVWAKKLFWDDRATSAVEFAFIAPVFLTLIFGLVAFGSYLGIVHGVQQLTAEAARASIAGLSDAYLYIRKPVELSDGQRYRFRLAKLLEQNTDVWVADEFGAVLDRTTAKIVAWNMAKAARANGKTLIVATTHGDLVDELAPSLSITKRFHERISVSRVSGE